MKTSFRQKVRTTAICLVVMVSAGLGMLVCNRATVNHADASAQRGHSAVLSDSQRTTVLLADDGQESHGGKGGGGKSHG